MLITKLLHGQNNTLNIFGKYVRLSVSLSVLSSKTREHFDIWSPKLDHMCIESLIPVSKIDKEVGHGTRSPGQMIGQI